jgi:hypothetical protein
VSNEGQVEWPEGHPGQPGGPPPPPPGGQYGAYPFNPQKDIPNHMAWAVTMTIVGFLFCWIVALPLGIVSIVFASQVDSKKRIGDIEGAMISSNKAKGFAIGATCAAGLGVLIFIVYIVMIVNDPSAFGY